MSKLIPFEKKDAGKPLQESLIGLVMEAKPYHVKLKDVIVELIFHETIDTFMEDPLNPPVPTPRPKYQTPSIKELVTVSMSDKMIETIDMLFDYHLYSNRGFGVTRFGEQRYESNQFDTIYTGEYGFNLYGYGMDHFGAMPHIEPKVDNSPTTIYAGITEHLVIDTTRRISAFGFGSTHFDVGRFDSIDMTNKLSVKAIEPIDCCDSAASCGPDPKLIRTFDGDTFDRLLVDSPSATPCPSPSPSPTPSVSPTPSPSPTPSITPTPSPTPSASASPVPTPSPSPSKSTPAASVSPSPSPSPSPSKSIGASPSPSNAPNPSPSPTPSKSMPVPSASPAASSSPKPSPSPSPSKSTPAPSSSPKPTPSPSPSKSPKPTPLPSPTPSPTPSKSPLFKQITGTDYDYSVMLINDVTTYTWSEAFAFANKMNQENYLGYSDWRVPNVMESRYLFDNKTALGLRSNSNFWTSETYEKTAASAYGLRTSTSITNYKSDTRQNILQSLFGTYSKELNKFYVRLIRG